MTIDTQRIESLLEEKKFDEVRALIAEIASSPLEKKEKGNILIGMTSTYLEVMNAISARYQDALEQAIEGMRAINRAEVKTGDAIKLSSIRKSLGI